MSSGTWCSCGQYVWSRDRHRCPPAYRVWCPDRCEDEEDAGVVHAHGPEPAAETWAERDDAHSADYAIVGGSPAIVHVRAPDGTLTVWRVTGEVIPSYSASEVARV